MKCQQRDSTLTPFGGAREPRDADQGQRKQKD